MIEQHDEDVDHCQIAYRYHQQLIRFFALFVAQLNSKIICARNYPRSNLFYLSALCLDYAFGYGTFVRFASKSHCAAKAAC